MAASSTTLFPESIASMFRKPNLNIRVVSYNVLSSHLASPSHFATLNPAHLAATARLPVVLQKIDAEISTHKRVIVCLQEVSYDWAGKIHVFFASKGYHVVTSNYGRSFNGYMGVVLAWPVAGFDAIDVDISRVSDTRPGGWPANKDPPPGVISKLLSSSFQIIQTILTAPLQKIGLISSPSRDAEPWDYAKSRMNVLLTAVLRDKESGAKFCISNYHMPCSFWDGRIMTLHADLCLAHVQRIALREGSAHEPGATNAPAKAETDPLPYILAGDFNIKPSDSIYGFMTTGSIHVDDPAHPGMKEGETWLPSIVEPVRSAYRLMLGQEPDFTNFAHVGDRANMPFIDTLDYIFLSPSWSVEKVRDLPARDVAGGPFPNLDHGEPSDHILIAATLSSPSK
jgi:2',5'-phosphodiesterase